MNTFSLVLILTRKCNANCHVCAVNRNNESMNFSIFQNSIKNLGLSIKDIQSVKFFGGECLLEFPLLKKCYYFFKQNNFQGKFETSTNSLALDEEKIKWFAELKDMQLNINMWFNPINDISILKQHIVWNLCIPSSNPFFAVERFLKTIRIYGKAVQRVNLIPQSFCIWSPQQLNSLNRTIIELLHLIKTNNVSLENINKYGDVPLFNNTLTMDTDGTVYASDICIADIPEYLKKVFKYKSGIDNSYDREYYLQKIFGVRQIVSTAAASAILSANIAKWH